MGVRNPNSVRANGGVGVQGDDAWDFKSYYRLAGDQGDSDEDSEGEEV